MAKIAQLPELDLFSHALLARFVLQEVWLMLQLENGLGKVKEQPQATAEQDSPALPELWALTTSPAP
jgi:hypothetical protein